MDLMKHLGKENQIQNYRLMERVEKVREAVGVMMVEGNRANRGKGKEQGEEGVEGKEEDRGKECRGEDRGKG